MKSFSFDDFYGELVKSSDPIDEFLTKFPPDSQGYTNEIIDKLKIAIGQQDSDQIEYLTILADADGLSSDYINTFCPLLQMDWHRSHEDIVMLLEEIGDPESIDCIFSMFSKKPLYLEYDDNCSLEKKCIWALGAIGSKYAIEKLTEISKSNNKVIRESALQQLNHLLNSTGQ